MPGMVVNVDTWGAGPNQLSRGMDVSKEVEDQVDMAWATTHRVVVTAEEYQQEHPEWRPPTTRETAPKPTPTTPPATGGSTGTSGTGGKA